MEPFSEKGSMWDLWVAKASYGTFQWKRFNVGPLGSKCVVWNLSMAKVQYGNSLYKRFNLCGEFPYLEL